MERCCYIYILTYSGIKGKLLFLPHGALILFFFTESFAFLLLNFDELVTDTN